MTLMLLAIREAAITAITADVLHGLPASSAGFHLSRPANAAEQRREKSPGGCLAHQVLIVTSRSDIHADAVIEAAATLGSRCFRLDLDRFPIDYGIDLCCQDGQWSGEIRHNPSDHTLSIASIGSIWLRSRACFAYPSDPLPAQERAHADAETDHMLLGLLHGLKGFWMSHPSALRAASWKPEQLQRATRLGFKIAPSMITNEPARAEAFRRAYGAVVFKPLSSPYLAADAVTPDERSASMLMTTLIDAHCSLDAVAEAPCFFQKYIAKRREWRVTIVGREIYAAKIDSQADIRTAIDSRDMSAEIAYEAGELPTEVAERCLALAHSYGLAYSAIDLIETPDGDWVFLENNPQGQFLYVEQLLPNLKVTDSVARALINGANGA